MNQKSFYKRSFLINLNFLVMTKPKKMLIGMAALAVAGGMTLNINVAKNSNGLSNTFLYNVEALAQQGDVSVPFICHMHTIVCEVIDDELTLYGIRYP